MNQSVVDGISQAEEVARLLDNPRGYINFVDIYTGDSIFHRSFTRMKSGELLCGLESTSLRVLRRTVFDEPLSLFQYGKKNGERNIVFAKIGKFRDGKGGVDIFLYMLESAVLTEWLKMMVVRKIMRARSSLAPSDKSGERDKF